MIVVREVNVIKKKIKPSMPRIALVYPSLYNVMVSSLSIHIIYYMLNEKYSDVYVERFHTKTLYGREPLPQSLETGSPLKDFDLIIISMHYEPDIARVVKLLYYSGIDPRRWKREKIVIAGGPPFIANPKPYSDIIDIAVIGEIEPTLPEIIEFWISYRDNKKKFLEEISSLEYTYVAEYDEDKTILKRWTKDLDQAYYPIRQFRSSESKDHVFEPAFMLESSRGCKYWCRYCMEGRIFNPYRYRSFTKLKEIIEKGLLINELRRVIIYSFIFPSSRDEKLLLEYLVDNNISASLPSIRLDIIDDDLLELIKGVGQKTLALAPETFSPYISSLFCKYVLDIDLKTYIYRVIDYGFNVKLYTIYGVKGETIEDVKKTINALKELGSYAKNRGVRLSISINPLIPKPWTLFQWVGMEDLEKIKKIYNMYRRELRGIIETRPLDINWAWVQAVISLADKDIGKILIEWGIEGGDLGSWRRVVRRNNYRLDYVFKGYNSIDELPWRNIVLDHVTEKIILYEYALASKLYKENIRNQE